MKAACKTALFFLSVVMVQSYAPYERHEYFNSMELHDELDDPTTSLKQLKEAIQKSSTVAIAYLQSLQEEASHKTEDIVVQDIKPLGSLFENVLLQLKKLKDHAESLDLHIADCLKHRDDYIMGLRLTYEEKVTKCGEDKFKEASALARTATVTVSGSNSTADVLYKRWHNCASGMLGYVCRRKAVAEVKKEIVSVPVNIVRLVNGVISGINSLYSEQQQCSSRLINEFLAEGNSKIADIENCIIEKITRFTPRLLSP